MTGESPWCIYKGIREWKRVKGNENRRSIRSAVIHLDDMRHPGELAYSGRPLARECNCACEYTSSSGNCHVGLKTICIARLPIDNLNTTHDRYKYQFKRFNYLK